MKGHNESSKKTAGFLTWWNSLTKDSRRLYICFAATIGIQTFITMTKYFEYPFMYADFTEAVLESIVGGSIGGVIVYPISTVISRQFEKK